MLRQAEIIRKESKIRYGFGIDAMKSIKVCEKCGEMAAASQQYCKGCGIALPDENLYQLYMKRHRHCRACGTIVNEQMTYCPDCGQRLEEKNELS